MLDQQPSTGLDPVFSSEGGADALVWRSSRSDIDVVPKRPPQAAAATVPALKLPAAGQTEEDDWADVLGLNEGNKTSKAGAGGAAGQVQVVRPPRDLGEPWQAHEGRQRATWRIGGLDVDLKRRLIKYRGIVVPPGHSMRSPWFSIGGHEGFLRFWPNGFFTMATRRSRRDMDLGGLRTDAWCAVGLHLAAGAKLRLRFIIGEESSEVRDCYWDGSTAGVQQVWMPTGKEPNELSELALGVEVIRNLRELPAARPRPRRPLGATPRSTPRSTATALLAATAPPTMGGPMSARGVAGGSSRLADSAGNTLPLPQPRLAPLLKHGAPVRAA